MIISHRLISFQELKDFGCLGGSCVAFCDVDKTRWGGGNICSFHSLPILKLIFSFIEYLSQEDADHTIEVLNNKELCSNIVGVAAYVSDQVSTLNSHD